MIKVGDKVRYAHETPFFSSEDVGIVEQIGLSSIIVRFSENRLMYAGINDFRIVK